MTTRQAPIEHAMTADGNRRTSHYRRDFRTIYVTTFVLSLVAMPLRRLATIARPHRGRRPSMLAQARSDAGIAASYALMGF